jgi:23S rRNA (adenine2503-C2)-methyltransferase
MNFNNSKINIYSLPKNELINALTMHKFSSFYIKSLIKQIFLGNIGDFKQLNFDNYKINILNDNFILNSSKIIKVLKDKNTTKFLIELYDKNVIEAVVLNYDHGNTLCVSTQVGCNMGCKFCASGINKKIRNLEVNEIIEQFILIKNDQKIKIKNIVFMGIGEPLDNYDNLTKSLKIFIDMLLIGPKHITVSTCGIMNKLQDFKNNFPNISIALSLHSCFDDIRSKLMPINNAYNLDQIIT